VSQNFVGASSRGSDLAPQRATLTPRSRHHANALSLLLSASARTSFSTFIRVLLLRPRHEFTGCSEATGRAPKGCPRLWSKAAWKSPRRHQTRHSAACRSPELFFRRVRDVDRREPYLVLIAQMCFLIWQPHENVQLESRKRARDAGRGTNFELDLPSADLSRNVRGPPTFCTRRSCGMSARAVLAIVHAAANSVATCTKIRHLRYDNARGQPLPSINFRSNAELVVGFVV